MLFAPWLHIRIRGMALKTYFVHLLGWLLLKKKMKTISIGKDVETLELLPMAGGNAKCCSCCGKQYAGSSKS